MIKIGILGSGPNGTGNAKSFARFPDQARIVATSDPNLAAAETLAAAHPGAQAHADFAAFLDAVDAVVISSPNWLHPEQAIACAEAGRHVWIEKPMALTTADADRIVAAVDRAGVKSMIGFSIRFNAIAQEMKRAVAAGELGRIISLWSRRLCDLKIPATGWRGDYLKSGGVMSELLTHEIDWAVSLMGFPQSVFCRRYAANPTHPRMNDHVWLSLSYGTDCTATIEGSQCSLVPEYYKGVLGEGGALVTFDWERQLKRIDADGKDCVVTLGERFDKHLHFLEVIEGRAESAADVHYGRGITNLIEKALDSAVSGQAVTL